MASELRFDGKVAIITGAGNGLGRSHALLFASRGAKVVVNDLGGSHSGEGKSSSAADKVVEEIKAAGGEAVANYDSVEDGDKIVETAMKAFGGVDIVVNNAGILRDVSFQKMTDLDWDLIYRVHVRGAYKVTKAAWDHMRDKGYGRILFTASAAGIYGNFGQVNYAMAKLGLVGMASALAIEGKKKNVLVNTIAPIAGSRMTETVLPPDLIEALRPEFVSPLVAYLAHESNTDTGGLYEVGGGFIGKLRWERTEGKLYKLAQALTPEKVKAGWAAISDFGKTTHPADITQSMQPILGNLGSKTSKGGNEFIDVDEALAAKVPDAVNRYDDRDVSLYALGIGATKDDLNLVYERKDDFVVFPTFAVSPMLRVMFDAAKGEGYKPPPGLNYGLDRVLHGEQFTEVYAPLPPAAKLTHKSRVKDIFDKGKNALVITETQSFDEKGRLLFKNEVTTFVRGAGGWGGDRGPSSDVNVPPDRAPDAVVEERTGENQAYIYRLSGDWNPLHVDPMFAQAFGFKQPILHGLATFGFAARHVVKTFAKGGDPRYFKSVKARFSASVFPGDTLVTEMWKESDTRILFRTKVKERGEVAISNAAVEFYKEIPRLEEPTKAAPTQAAATAGPVSSEPTTGDIFTAIGKYIEQNPNLASQVGTVFQFDLTSPASAYNIDLKNGKGKVTPGSAAADCTLEIADADFMAMATGKADAQKLYFGGKLKISGNVMASQKLEFLKKLDPTLVLDAAKARAGAGGGAGPAPAAAPTPSPAEATPEQAFWGMNWYIEQTPGLVAQVGQTFQFKLTSASYFVDLKNGKGGVRPGEPEKADVTLEISDADFMAMSTGKADPQKLYFGGKLKISGNVMAAQKLEFLKKIDAAAAAKAYLAAHGGAAPGAAPAAPGAAAPAAAKTEPKAKAIFARAKETLEKTPGLAAEVGGVVQFVVKNPDGAWFFDGKTIQEGKAAEPATTCTIDDADLAALAAGAAAHELHQHGKLRVDGDLRPATKLAFLKALPRAHHPRNQGEHHESQGQCHRRRHDEVRQARRERGLSCDGVEGREGRHRGREDRLQGHRAGVRGVRLRRQHLRAARRLRGRPHRDPGLQREQQLLDGLDGALPGAPGGRGRARRVRARRRLREDGEGRARLQVQRPHQPHGAARGRDDEGAGLQPGASGRADVRRRGARVPVEVRHQEGDLREGEREGAQARVAEPVRHLQRAPVARADHGLARGLRSADALPVLPADVRRRGGDPLLGGVREEARAPARAVDRGAGDDDRLSLVVRRGLDDQDGRVRHDEGGREEGLREGRDRARGRRRGRAARLLHVERDPHLRGAPALQGG